MAIVFGLILSVVMGAANVYLGLRVGMTVSASIPAAVLAIASTASAFVVVPSRTSTMTTTSLQMSSAVNDTIFNRRKMNMNKLLILLLAVLA